ncbi:hypothetical protein I4U23_026131 [Adineta vaga]|nr:hypothetical protein I4U23_026131 [Adineta vaga]
MISKTRRASFSASSTALLAVPYAVTPGESRNFDLTTSSNLISTSSTNDPPFLFNNLRSAEWLQRYGLKSQKLTFDQILQRIGFKRVEGYDAVVGKTITAKYAGNLYNEVQHENGDRYVLTCRPEKLREYLQRLEKMLHLLRKRLTFLNSGSRRLFGIIGEPSVCLICDCKTVDYRLFNQFQLGITSLLKEQITKIKKFNIIWISNDNEQFREQPIDVNSTNIDRAIDWVYDRKCPKIKISLSATCEAVLKAFKNDVDAFYLISEGDSSDYAREMLRDNIVKTRLSSQSPKPFNVVSLFCHNNDTQTFLRSIAQSADGNYFCYKIKDEISDLKAPSNSNDPTRIKLQDDKLLIGTNILTTTSEYPVDIALMYKEIIECQSIVDRIEKIVGYVRDESQNSFAATKSSEAFNASGDTHFQRSVIIPSSTLFSNDENEMRSIDWLKISGIDAQKLDFFSVLQAAAFRHCDGVVKVLKPPENSDEVTDSTPANPQNKLINAIYCDQFAHVAWPDGTIRHVHVTPELHRDYERRLRALMEKIKARLKWLKKGSRELFGSVLENNIYVLIDTSKSMQHHLGYVKDKLRLLINDQLFAKERINMVAFNTVVNPWRDRLTKITDSTTISQLQPWIDGLSAEGSTNTLGALRFALADPATDAIYLLTDGRPDQNERHILSQVQYRQTVPIHTIAFNCQDQTANQFLHDLSKQTGGRFHAFQYGLEKQTTVEIPESEDVGTLKRELIRGQEELERIASLRDECLGQAWSRDNLLPRVPKSKTRQSSHDKHSATSGLKSHSALNITFSSNKSTMPQRRTKKKCSTTNQNQKFKSRSVTNLTETTNVLNVNSNQWLLPETKDYLQGNDKKDEERSDKEDEQPVERPIETKKARTPYETVKFYLKRHSLIAKGLTLFDVLHPVSITVKEPRHIQVIDRVVLSKVWNDILPLTYGSHTGKLRLVNHYAVNLEKYEEQLKALIATYHQFTLKFIWKHLNDEDRKNLTPYWQNLLKDERNKALERPVTGDENNETLSKEDEVESALKGIGRMDVEIQRAIKFLQISTDLRKLQKRADTDTKPSDGDKPKPLPLRPSVYPSIGQRVIYIFDDGFYYPGIIQKGPDSRTIIVLFDMGIQKIVIGHKPIPINGAIAQPNLFVEDRVLVRQRNNNNDEIWVPGIVLVLPSPSAQPPALYTVEIYTPHERQVNVQRRDLIKISDGLFQTIIQNIRNIIHLHVPPTKSPEKKPSGFSIEDIIRKELEPLTNQIERYNKSHLKRYRRLKQQLADQLYALRLLQEKTLPQDVLVDKPSESRRPSSQRSDRPDSPKKVKPTDDSPTLVDNPEETLEGFDSKTINRNQQDIIEPNTAVYACWLDYDKFFYQGVVVEKQKDENSYRIQRKDLLNSSIIIPRDHIFLETQCRTLRNLEDKSFVLIRCPNDFRRCWQPAVILRSIPDKSERLVRFYDCIDKEFSNSTIVIPITERQFTDYTQLRIEYEKSLINQTIVGFNEVKKVYMLGTIIQRLKNGHEFRIEWSDETESAQEEKHLFGAFSQLIDFQVNCFVLAVDDSQYIYKPAIVEKISSDKNTVTVRFFESMEQEKEIHVPSIPTFVITEAYYNSIIKRFYE